MTAAATAKIDDLMEIASEALAAGEYFKAERKALQAITAARAASDFERMGRITLPLQEARRQRFQIALETREVCIVDEPVAEDTRVKTGCYLVQPPSVGADARRMRFAGLQQETPVAIVCREPLTQLRLCPIVAVSPGVTVRTKVDPPADPENPDLAWFAMAMDELGHWAIDTLDPELQPFKRVDALLEKLEAEPEHEGLHQALIEACRIAEQVEGVAPPPKKRRGAAS
jgi:hypothetical protein